LATVTTAATGFGFSTSITPPMYPWEATNEVDANKGNKGKQGLDVCHRGPEIGIFRKVERIVCLEAEVIDLNAGVADPCEFADQLGGPAEGHIDLSRRDKFR
jgi:hypothetical protein